MSLAAAPEGAWAVGQYGLLTLNVSGANPVHAATVDFPNDGQPAWYYVVADARPSLQYWVGPFKKAGRFQLIVNARDERGCEVTNVPGQYVTIAR
jgi:hypothetical protein